MFEWLQGLTRQQKFLLLIVLASLAFFGIAQLGRVFGGNNNTTNPTESSTNSQVTSSNDNANNVTTNQPELPLSIEQRKEVIADTQKVVSIASDPKLSSKNNAEFGKAGGVLQYSTPAWITKNAATFVRSFPTNDVSNIRFVTLGEKYAVIEFTNGKTKWQFTWDGNMDLPWTLVAAKKVK